VRLGLSLEIREFAAGAGTTGGVLGDAHRLEAAAPNVTRVQAAVERFLATGKKLKGFGYF
jgi:cysteine synthase